ncbi:MAG: DNA repair protein RecN [Gammaproteobacteria bacterium]|nr:DNA repair protein RecN [Gammaproteobacteria bacterium]
MLTHIQIRDFAIIEKMELEFDGGLTVLTGETGAGKSILIDALNLVLGDRADADTVRFGAAKAEINAEFDLADRPSVLAWLRENDFDDEQYCSARRVITSEGRSRGYLNGRSVPMQTLRELGEQLVDIHGQHAHQSLLRRPEQLNLLDNYGKHAELQTKVREVFKFWEEKRQALDKLYAAQTDRSARLDLLRYQVRELIELDFKAGESAELEKEHKRFIHAGRLLEGVQLALASSYDNDQQSAYSLLSQAVNVLQDLSELDPELPEILKLFNSALINLQEGAEELRRYTDNLEIDPERRDWVENRISLAQQLARKHHVTVEELPLHLEKLQTELDDLENAGERLDELEQQVAKLSEKYSEAAGKLTRRRKKTAKELSGKVTEAMQELGMPGGEFVIQIAHDESRFTANGVDAVEMLVSANPGQPVKPLNKVASGGELSRISLAIQVIAAHATEIPTMVFDEVDAGVGGGIAEMIGKRLRSIGKTRQVFCVTHLPQVASQANHHFQVAKQTDGKTTHTQINALDGRSAVEELARMLGGMEVTEATLRHAREMVEKAKTGA